MCFLKKRKINSISTYIKYYIRTYILLKKVELISNFNLNLYVIIIITIQHDFIPLNF